MRLNRTKIALVNAEIAQADRSHELLAHSASPDAELAKIVEGWVKALPGLAKLSRYEGRFWARHTRAQSQWAVVAGERRNGTIALDSKTASRGLSKPNAAKRI